ncbi:MAG TPA: hypothetical protein VNB06_00075 [Thermoanaerobaculia bacterium]|nr:hypothetical protein [Thermoanaerobaculia bacterium]
MEIFLYLAVWALWGIVGFAIGKRKHRPEAGFWWGLFLGPIGWLIVGLGPNMGPRCDECGGLVVPGSRRCRHCGAELLEHSYLT